MEGGREGGREERGGRGVSEGGELRLHVYVHVHVA